MFIFVLFGVNICRLLYITNEQNPTLTLDCDQQPAFPFDATFESNQMQRSIQHCDCVYGGTCNQNAQHKAFELTVIP